jgi:predicted PolB exonuclease-like 3'-5' exonuclease
MLLNNWDSRAKGDFDFFCKLFLGEGKPGGMDGSMVQHYWDCGMVDKIVEYCKDDVAKVAALYERLTGFYY